MPSRTAFARKDGPCRNRLPHRAPWGAERCAAAAVRWPCSSPAPDSGAGARCSGSATRDRWRSSMKAKDVMTRARHHRRAGRLDPRSAAVDAAAQDQRPAGGRQERQSRRHRHRRRFSAPRRDRNRAQASALGRVPARPGNARQGLRSLPRPQNRRSDDHRRPDRRGRLPSSTTSSRVMEKHRVKRVPVMRGTRWSGSSAAPICCMRWRASPARSRRARRPTKRSATACSPSSIASPGRRDT